MFSKKITIQDIDLEVENYTYQGENNGGRIWHTEDGDGLGVYYFDMHPDLPDNISNSAELFAFYEEQLSRIGGQIVELDIRKIDGVNAIFLIIKAPQEPSGMTYIASYTIPYKAFSFVIKVQCLEHGITGVKEALLVDRILAKNGSLEGANWDSSEYDDEFPNHPVARARRIINDAAGGEEREYRTKSKNMSSCGEWK